MFNLKIKTGGAAFRSEEFTDRRGSPLLDPYSREIRRLLSKVQKDLADGETMGALMDINGNRVGEWSLE